MRSIDNARVTFVAPDMNWDDVRRVLAGGEARSAIGPLQNGEGIEFFGEVRAFTDTSNMNYTVFCLEGEARVGITQEAMADIFRRLRTYLPSAVSRDPCTWLLLGSGKPKKLAAWMDMISHDEQLTEAFIQDEPVARVTTGRVNIRYFERYSS